LELGSKSIDTDLIILGLEGIDVILGMDWMNRHKVVLDISEKVVEINSPIVGAMTLYLPLKDDVNPHSYVAITSQLVEIPVVREFADVFPDELPVCHPIEMSSLSLSFSLAQPLSSRDLTVCHPRN
jgi:hypothetical protein